MMGRLFLLTSFSTFGGGGLDHVQRTVSFIRTAAKLFVPVFREVLLSFYVLLVIDHAHSPVAAARH